MRFICAASVVAAALVIAVLIGCGRQVGNIEVPPPAAPEPTPSPRALSLPGDDAPHESPIEWWYYNGHLESEDGREFSFHYVVFRSFNESTGKSAEYVQMGIADVVDLEHRHHRSTTVSGVTESTAVGSGSLVDIDLGEFRLQIDHEGDHKIFGGSATAENFLELRLGSTEQAMLHKGIGWMDWPFGWTYYYSYPRMQTNGTVVFDGQRLDVSGEVWFDHQWGDFFVVGKPAGWQWFAIHLDNGDSLMISEVRGADGDVIGVDGTLMRPDEAQKTLEGDGGAIGIEVLDHWLSPHTGGNYPSGWRIVLPEEGLDMVLEPVIDDQEIPAIPFGNQAAAYWEGRADAFDYETGERIGKSFVELSGYVDPDPLIWRPSNE